MKLGILGSQYELSKWTKGQKCFQNASSIESLFLVDAGNKDTSKTIIIVISIVVILIILSIICVWLLIRKKEKNQGKSGM